MKNHIRTLRLEHGGMSQQELANLVGCRHQTIIALEQDEYVPSVELAFKISRAFEVAIEEVFQYEEKAISTGEGRSKKRIGLALSGGGARGLAHIGVLKVLEKEGIHIDMIAGTSIGALIGAVYAQRRKAAVLESLAVQWGARRFSLFGDLTIWRGGLIRGRRIEKMLVEILGDTEFKELHIPFACVATNIDSGEEVIMKQGLVRNAVRASISIPVILKAVRNESRYLVDGGLVDNMPADVLREMGADFIIAVNVTPNAQLQQHEYGKYVGEKMKQPSILHVMMRTMQIVNRRALNSELIGANVTIEPELEHIGWGDFHRVPECVLQGKLAASDAIPEIKRRLA